MNSLSLTFLNTPPKILFIIQEELHTLYITINRHYKLKFLLWANLEINYYITTQVLKFVGNYIFTIVLDVIVKVSKFLAFVSPHALGN